jgi:hypothetical protein
MADFRNQFDRLTVSTDGSRVEFGYEAFGKRPAHFDRATRTLLLAPGDSGMTVPRQTGLQIEHWLDKYNPTLDGKVLVERFETSRSLAIHPFNKGFVLGTAWWLRAYDEHGAPLGGVPCRTRSRLSISPATEGSSWRPMVTGRSAGTGWNGAELLAFMPMPDRTNWVAWTPEGFYAATAGAQGVLPWHLNRDWDQPADSVPVEGIPGSYRPEVLALVLQELETPRALGLADMAEHNRQVMLRTHSHISP